MKYLYVINEKRAIWKRDLIDQLVFINTIYPNRMVNVNYW